MKELEQQPFIDVMPSGDHVGGYVRRVAVFNYSQAPVVFSGGIPRVPDWVLCVDKNVCKWVQTLLDAHDFFEPQTRYECLKCDYIIVAHPRPDIIICPEDGSILKATGLGDLRKRLAQRCAGKL